jgi:hypothetical protein
VARILLAFLPEGAQQMKRAAIGAVAVFAGVATACGAGNTNPNEMKSEVEVTGCLTGANDQFVLTELDRAETGTTIASPATESYRLIGDADTLRPHVGKQVRVAGMAETPEVAIVRESSPPASAAQPGVGTAGADTPRPSPEANAPEPKVSTGQQARLEVSSLRVRSITPTAGSCTP